MKFSRYGLRLQAQRSNESPSGAFKQRNGLAQQDGGASPREVSRKEKYRPRSTGEGFCRVKRRQNESGVLRGGKNLHGEQILAVLYFSTKLVGFVTENIMVCRVRQDGFVKFIAIKL